MHLALNTFGGGFKLVSLSDLNEFNTTHMYYSNKKNTTYVYNRFGVSKMYLQAHDHAHTHTHTHTNVI